MAPLFEVRQTDGKGYGVFAKKLIRPNTIIIDEQPIMTAKPTTEQPAVVDASIEAAFKRLSKKDRDRVLELCWTVRFGRPVIQSTTLPQRQNRACEHCTEIVLRFQSISSPFPNLGVLSSSVRQYLGFSAAPCIFVKSPTIFHSIFCWSTSMQKEHPDHSKALSRNADPVYAMLAGPIAQVKRL
ncbi:Hypothetical predicted protein [Lecanosticta acicola]|uniref:Uncharacterized protein n=1 Tax=Lecanosticta acicola TaxID=111012 RepID=A0AAI8Z757_9PEZI|nr:Hypothetical predicted protein [Lecanosticta acicola]